MIKLEIEKNGEIVGRTIFLSREDRDAWIPEARFGERGSYRLIETDISPKNADHRRNEFIKIDQLKDEAIIEFLAEGRSEKMDLYKRKREEIKRKYPPEA